MHENATVLQKRVTISRLVAKEVHKALTRNFVPEGAVGDPSPPRLEGSLPRAAGGIGHRQAQQQCIIWSLALAPRDLRHQGDYYHFYIHNIAKNSLQIFINKQISFFLV